MPLVPLYGHTALRGRFARMIARGDLPASLLLQGHRGVGKQRLALWLAQARLCQQFDAEQATPCGQCYPCRSVQELRYPDLYWIYPRPRLKTADPDAGDVLDDYAESIAERLEHHGLYGPSSGSDGLYIVTIKTIVQKAATSPAVGHHKVFIVGDADRMISQEGADQAANAFLKLLEEPPADTTLILTSSEPGALLPTIRSRVVSFRCAPLADAEMRAFLNDPLVVQELNARDDLPGRLEDRLALASGAPGALLAGDAWRQALQSAHDLLRAAERRDAERYAIALGQGASNARGAFSDTLDALNIVLRDRARAALERGDANGAYGASQGVDAVARAQTRADGNVNPQLVAARLIRELSTVLS